MCGIAGYINLKDVSADLDLVKKMTDAMAHRGPDADGLYKDGCVGLGHRRLSIIDLSDSANQPFVDSAGRWHLIFNGELFNFNTVKNEIDGVNWRTSGDTEVLAESLLKWGIDGVSKFKGMFAFAAWDQHEKALYLVRDRLGVKPLYYYNDGESFFFSSEIRSILATGKCPPEMDLQAVFHFLKYQSTGGEHSIIKNIQQLAPGHFIKIKNGQVEKRQYWDITKNNTPIEVTDHVAVHKTIRTLLSNAVEQRLISDVPIGAFLSGGIDSSAVVGLMREVGKSRPVTFNVSFSESDFDESSYANIVAKKFDTDHHTIFLKPESLIHSLPSALDAMDTPSGDGVNTYIVSKAVKEAGLTVALSGVGGDELFAGYPFFPRYKKLNSVSGLWNASLPIRNLSASFLKNEKWHSLFQMTDTGIDSVYPVLREILSDREINKLLITNGRSVTDETRELLSQLKTKLGKFPLLSQVSIAEYLGYTCNTLLKDTDQMSMAVSLEVREPFFDHELIEYVLRLPDSIKNPIYPKKLLVESLNGLLPEEIVHRKKQGFTFPWKHWLRKDLRDFCDVYIRNACDRKFINADYLSKKWKAFQSGDTSVNWMEIWLLVILEYWMEKNGVDA